MFGVDTASGSPLYSRELPTLQPFAITVYDNESPVTFNNPCSTLNCHHMCVNTQSGPKYASPFYEKGFIVSNASMFAMHEILSNDKMMQNYIFRYIPGNIIESFAIDSNLDIIYFVDGKSSSLKKFTIRSNQLNTLISISASTDLIFDWIANLLGWIEPRQSSIRSFSVNSQTTDTIYSNLQNPEYLTIDPNNGLYWLEQTFIKSSTTKGSDIKSHINTKGAKKIFAYKGYFVWINEDRLHFHIANTFQAEYTLPTLQSPRDAAIFDSSLQNDKRGLTI